MATFSRSGFSAARYATYRPKYPAELIARVVALVPNSPQGGPKTCLDLGCGTGVASTALAPHFTEVIGLDPSQLMIAQAEAQNTIKNLRFQVGTAEDLSSIADKSVSLVVAAQSVHWVNFTKAWPEITRVLKPGIGAVAFWGYKDNVFLEHPKANKILDHFIYGEGEVARGIEGLGSFWEQPGRNILRNLYRDIKFPAEFEDPKRYEHEAGATNDQPGWKLTKTMKLGDIENYFRTYSSYKAWVDEHKDRLDESSSTSSNDVFDVMWKTIREAEDGWNTENWRDIEVTTDWGTCLITGRHKASE